MCVRGCGGSASEGVRQRESGGCASEGVGGCAPEGAGGVRRVLRECVRGCGGSASEGVEGVRQRVWRVCVRRRGGCASEDMEGVFAWRAIHKSSCQGSGTNSSTWIHTRQLYRSGQLCGSGSLYLVEDVRAGAHDAHVVDLVVVAPARARVCERVSEREKERVCARESVWHQCRGSRSCCTCQRECVRARARDCDV